MNSAYLPGQKITVLGREMGFSSGQHVCPSYCFTVITHTSSSLSFPNSHLEVPVSWRSCFHRLSFGWTLTRRGLTIRMVNFAMLHNFFAMILQSEETWYACGFLQKIDSLLVGPVDILSTVSWFLGLIRWTDKIHFFILACWPGFSILCWKASRK